MHADSLCGVSAGSTVPQVELEDVEEHTAESTSGVRPVAANTASMAINPTGFAVLVPALALLTIELLTTACVAVALLDDTDNCADLDTGTKSATPLLGTFNTETLDVEDWVIENNAVVGTDAR